MADKDYTDDELDQLTDEEREALESDDDYVDDDDADTDDDSTDADDDSRDDDASGTRESGDDDASDADAGEDDQPGRDDGADPAAQAEPGQPARKEYSPSLNSKLPDDFDQQLSKIASDRTELRKKYNEGDIDFDEYEQQRDALDDQRRTLEQQKFKADIADEMRADRWINRDVASFLAEHPEYKSGSSLHRMLDEEVRTLQAKAESEGKDPLDPAILQAAHKNIREGIERDLGITAPAKTATRRQAPPPARNVPPTLANVPAAELEGTDGGRWASLDRLAETNPEKYEDKLAALSDADREAYLASQ